MQHLCGEGWLDLGEIFQYRPRIPAISEIWQPPIRTITRRSMEKDETLCLVTGPHFRLLVPRSRYEILLLLGLLDFEAADR